MTLLTVDIGRGGMTGQQFVPVAGVSDWAAICTDPKTDDNTFKNRPLSISRETQKVGMVNRGGTEIEVCLRYNPGFTVTTAPIVRVIGISSSGIPQLLANDDGDTEFELATDSDDLLDAAGNAYTATVRVDGRNNPKVMVEVITALAGGGTVGADDGPKIMAKAV